MCTVSWLRSFNGYTLISNRDEKITRSEALPPAILSSRGVRYVAPRDADCGGTWITANELGVSLCLLNGTGGYRGECSRGHLITQAAHAGSIGELEGLLSTKALGEFAPFVLLALSIEDAVIFRWNGISLTREQASPMRGVLTSSSFDESGVKAARERAFKDAFYLEPIHRSHTKGRSAYSVCMHRPDAKTVSLTRVDVGPEGSFMAYQPGSPCEGHRRSAISISRN